MDDESFNPHTREGVTCFLNAIPWYVICFNPHTREGVTYIQSR